MDSEHLPAVPDDLTTLSDDELRELREALYTVEQQIYSGDPEVVEGKSNPEVMAEFEQVIASIKAVDAEIKGREDEAAKVAADMDALHAQVATDESESDDEDEADAESEDDESEDEKPAEDAPAEEPVLEGEVVEEPALVASMRPFRPRRRVIRDEEPAPTNDVVLTAAADVPGFSSGTQITKHQLAEAMIAKRRAFVSAPQGYREKVVVASAYTDYGEDRTYDEDDPDAINKIKEALGMQSPGMQSIENLVAAGGICAPTDVRYAWDVLGVTSTPVWDSLPKFNAARGGIRFPVIPTIADITTAITTVTSAQDAAGGSSAVKDCQEVSCPSFTEVLVDIVSRCLEFPNLTARTYPEMVTGWNELLAIAFAQEMEAKALTRIKALSTDVNDIAEGTEIPADIGALGQLFPVLLQVGAVLRNSLRLDPGAALRVLLPAYVLDLLLADFHRRHSSRPVDITRMEIQAHFNSIGMQPTFYLDSSATGSQAMAAQTAAGLVAYPTLTEAFIFREGTFLGLDAGQLDLGVVRDSTLNSTNKYQIFAEVFQNIAKVGGQSVQIEVPLHPTGAASLDKTVTGATSE